MVVQHNLQAMNANRMLSNTTREIGGSTEKLSSGYRINRAADDAAGLSISEKMRKQIRGLTRASVNSEDGISCVQTADGAMTEVQNMLQRMNELCVQAANGTNSITDRTYIQDEIDQLISEIDRISETAKFNETYLLKGDETKKSTVYVTDYQITPTRNTVEHKLVHLNGDPIDKKILYKGTNNLYFIDSEITKSGNSSTSAQVIHTGDDMSEFLVYEDNDYNSYSVAISDDYRTFMNIELDSRLGTQGDTDRDMYEDPDNGVIRSTRRLYFYDTDTGLMHKVEADSDISEYLNDDRTVKDKYRFVDIMDGSGKFDYDENVDKGIAKANTNSTTIYYFDSDRNLHSIVYNADDELIKSAYQIDGQGRYGFKVTNGIVHHSGICPEPGCSITTLHNHVPKDALILYKNNLYKLDFGSHSNIYYCGNDLKTTIKLKNISDPTDTFNVPAGLFTETHHTEPQYNTTYNWADFTYMEPYTDYTKETDPTTDGRFEITDDLIEYEYSPEKLYDADGNEVSAIKLNDYFDDQGNYKGGLFNHPQAASINEVFNPLVAPDDSRNIEFYITQSSTQENDTLNLNIHAGSDSDRHNKIGIDIENMNAAMLGVNKLASRFIGIVDNTGEKATDAIDVVAAAINMISKQRAKMGAIQNRLDHTIKNLDNIIENTTASESTIRDTDMAKEMVTNANKNILLNAGQSMLAQANQSNQGVLSLLQ